MTSSPTPISCDANGVARVARGLRTSGEYAPRSHRLAEIDLEPSGPIDGIVPVDDSWLNDDVTPFHLLTEAEKADLAARTDDPAVIAEALESDNIDVRTSLSRNESLTEADIASLVSHPLTDENVMELVLAHRDVTNDALRPALTHRTPEVRCWALVGGSWDRDEIVAGYADSNPQVREAAIASASCPPDVAVLALSDPDPDVRAMACLSESVTTAQLLNLIKDDDEWVRHVVTSRLEGKLFGILQAA